MEFTDFQKEFIEELISSESSSSLTPMGNMSSISLLFKEKGIVLIMHQSTKSCFVCINVNKNITKRVACNSMRFIMNIVLLIQYLEKENYLKIWTEPSDDSISFVGLGKRYEFKNGAIIINKGEEIILKDLQGWIDVKGNKIYEIYKFNGYFDDIYRIFSGIPVFSNELTVLVDNRFKTSIEIAQNKNFTISLLTLIITTISLIVAIISFI